MKNYRMGSGVAEHYTSLESLREGWNLKPVSRRTNDENKLTKQREKFGKTHRCKACGQPMTFLPNTNIMTCTSATCKGIKHEVELADGSKRTDYYVSFDELDDLGAEIAQNIFD